MSTHLNILYIGNEEASLELLNKQKNISLTIVNNNLAAVNFLNSNEKPTTIICDYNLTGSNGFFLFDWVRERSEFNTTSFILLTKEFSVDLFKLAFEKRVDDFYVISPKLSENLLTRIQFLYNFKNKTTPTELPVQKSDGYHMPFTKRLFDIFVAGSVLLVASPFLLLIIIAIRLESKGKVYYIAKRVGRKTFDFYKLRSMRTGSDELLKKLAKEKNQYNTGAVKTKDPLDEPCPRCSELPEGKSCSPMMYVDTHHICDYWHNHQKSEAAKNDSTFVKIVDDPRVTKVGKFIRNTSIDELPQLINVLKGDMSIVGNRPLPVYEAELLTADTLSKRFLAPAGITGLWQVELRGKGGDMSEDERKRLDNEYADHFKDGNFSFWYDIKLILRTIPALFQKSSV
ncbi:sugar transferase [Lutibacter agarilyticus]|uniref:Sugar transferase n=1 Tax=Lutibacter agarilyticus TaxID=1109740 RepID=A0A238XZ99_9FLAO|nr:sugar transferase [Lutibacter agarilyticus]SNR64032.1 sugar transferase [Lutibacter agarilyticus]